MELVNFAHGEFLMVAMYVAFFAWSLVLVFLWVDMRHHLHEAPQVHLHLAGDHVGVVERVHEGQALLAQAALPKGVELKAVYDRTEIVDKALKTSTNALIEGSILVAVISLGWLYSVARKATAGVPSKSQAFVEMLFEFVDGQVKDVFTGDRRFFVPLALTIFVWVLMMNAMDLLPLDLLPNIWAAIYGAAGHDPHHAYLRVVPTADLSVTMGLSLSVLLVCLAYNVKIKGLGGWIHELFSAPFGAHPLLWPFNFLMQMIEFLAKTVSHGMRLFGNMFAGELIFLLLALWMLERVLEPRFVLLLLGAILVNNEAAARVGGFLLPGNHVDVVSARWVSPPFWTG